MAERQITRTEAFESHLKRLSRKYPDFPSAVGKFLNEAAKRKVPVGDQIPGLAGEPVYKARLPLGNKGKRGGARLIYYCSPDRVVALYAYAKSDIEDVPAKQIRDALLSLRE